MTVNIMSSEYVELETIYQRLNMMKNYYAMEINFLIHLFREQTKHVLDESRSFFRVHTGYFSNIPKCIKAEFIASWACSQSSVVSSSQR
ncbi:hypothetical protein TNCV_4572021 [Trichonephila clavipes]|nr:hypothetical protein TNCV_4572021 [Trichonephila clavipes]